MLLVCPLKHSPVKIDIETSHHSILPLDDDGDPNVIASFDRRGKYVSHFGSGVRNSARIKYHLDYALNCEGDDQLICLLRCSIIQIYTGNSRGRICVLSTKSFKTVASFRITAGNNIIIKSIEFARRGNR